MSKERRTIEIAPGLLSQGNGYHWQEDEWQDRYKKECPICKGSGKLDAVIKVEWQTSESKKK